MTTAPRRLRSVSVTLGVTALVAAGLTGCSPEADNRAICVDPQTEERVDDDYCDDDHTGGGHGYSWYYMRAGTRAPAVGSSYTSAKGTFSASSLSGSTVKGGVSDDGGTVSRGGFGGGGHSSS